MRIGYQGIRGSNAEEATLRYILKHNIRNYSLHPLTSSFNVVEALKDNTIDLGVMAFQNSTTGLVEETLNATKGYDFIIVDTISLPIRHCLFKYPGIKNSDIKYIASHIQALKQCKKHLEKNYPSLIQREVADQALAAYDLSIGKISEDTAILCRRNAGELYHLELMEKDLQDVEDNETTFHIIKDLK